MTVLTWILKNPLLSACLAMLLGVSVWGSFQKVGRLTAERKSAQCEASLIVQNDAVEKLGQERDRLKRDLARARKDAEEILKDANVRIEAMRARPVADNCTGNVKRFAEQLEGTRW